MIPIRIQGCMLGIFGLKSWDPPRPLHSQVSPYSIFPQQGHLVNEQSHLVNGRTEAFEFRQSNPNVAWPKATVPGFTSEPNMVKMEKKQNDLYPNNGNVQWSADRSGQFLTNPNSRWSSGQGDCSLNGNNTQLGNMNSRSGGRNCDPMSHNGWEINMQQSDNGVRSQLSSKTDGIVSRHSSSSESVPHSGGTLGWLSETGSAPVSRTWTGLSETVNLPQPRRVTGSCLSNGNWPDPSSSVFVPKVSLTMATPQELENSKSSWQAPATPAFSTKVDSVSASRVGCKLVAKHNYKANPNSLLGDGVELNLKQMEKLTWIGRHPQQELWWLVRNERGEEGYIPSTYVNAVEDNGGLPWLQNRAPKEEAMPVFTEPHKPYQSAYNRNDAASKAISRYYCETCGKDFNGPLPYRSHMASRAHREMVENA